MIFYLCDRKACAKCRYPTCSHTTKIEHAVNFTKHDMSEVWIERPDDQGVRYIREVDRHLDLARQYMQQYFDSLKRKDPRDNG